MVTKAEIQEIIEVLQDINAEMGEQVGYDTEIRMVFTTDGYGADVGIMGFTLWSSEEETREYYEETDTYEPWKQCFKRVLRNKVAEFNKVKI